MSIIRNMRVVDVCPYCDSDDVEVLDNDTWNSVMIELWHCGECKRNWRAYYNIEFTGIQVYEDIQGHPDLVGLRSFGFIKVEDDDRVKVFSNGNLEIVITFHKILRITEIESPRKTLEFNEAFWEAFNNEKVVAFMEDND